MASSASRRGSWPTHSTRSDQARRSVVAIVVSVFAALATLATLVIPAAHAQSATVDGGSKHSESHEVSIGIGLRTLLDEGDIAQPIAVLVVREIDGETSVDVIAVDSQTALDELLRDPTVVALDLARLDVETRGVESAQLVGADLAFADGVDGRGVTVAIIDSGVDATHPDLSSAVTFEACFMLDDNNTGTCPDGSQLQFGPGSAADDLWDPLLQTGGHGTLVAGVIAGAGTIAPRGIAPGAKIEMYRSITLLDDLDAMQYILDFRPDVDILNLSLGYDFGRHVTACDTFDDLHAAYFGVFEAFRERGILVVASAGNDGAVGMTLPACLSNVLSVTATTTDPRSELPVNQVAPWANIAVNTDVAAPGDFYVTTASGGGSAEVDGTSFSAPLVAACAALLHQVGYRTLAQLEERLTTSEVEAYDPAADWRLPLVDCDTGPAPTGNVNCDGQMSIADSLVIARLTVGIVTDAAQCPLGDPVSQINAGPGDVNADGQTNITDALILSQCTVAIPNLYCPEPIPAN